MKKFLIAAVAASLVGTPALAQSYGSVTRTKVVQNHRGQLVKKVTVKKVAPQHRRWAKGQRFDRRYATNYRVIRTPRAYRLHDAPRGYYWARSGDDALLVGGGSGVIAAVFANVIR